MNTKKLVWIVLPALGLVAALVAAPACSHSDAVMKTASATTVAGPQDSHCGTKVVTVSPAVCKTTGGDAGAGGDAGTTGRYGATMSNGEADDDDCKYHLKWSSGAASSTTTKTLTLFPLHGEPAGTAGDGGDVTFTVTLTNKKDGSPVIGAPVEIEAFLDDTHPALNSTQTSKETSPGTYEVGPVRFDVSGRWTVRFHIHDECNDSEESPHGHGAFFTQVTVQ